MVAETVFLFYFSHQKFISYRFKPKWKVVPSVFIIVIIKRIMVSCNYSVNQSLISNSRDAEHKRIFSL